MPSDNNAEPLDSFEVQLLSYLEFMKETTPTSYLSYRRSALEPLLFFHNGLSSKNDEQ